MVVDLLPGGRIGEAEVVGTDADDGAVFVVHSLRVEYLMAAKVSKGPGSAGHSTG